MREYARYLEFAELRILTDELTEASEKLAMVMHNPFDFEMKNDGDLYAEDGSNLGDVLRGGLVAAEQMALINPNFITEVKRNVIELQEYDDQRRLALGGEGDPDILVVESVIPEVVIDGVDLGAYDANRMKTLVRIHQRTGRGIRSTSISLDRSDRKGLQAIARLFGQTIHDDDSSEDILAMRMWGYSSALPNPVNRVRRVYDEQLERRYGGDWYGGRQDGDVIDALSFIKKQPDIIEAHMRRMKQIENLPPSERKKAREDARYDFAATLDDRRNGGTTIGDSVDLASSGGEARAEGREYKSDCPTAELQNQNQDPNEPSQAQQAAKKLYEKSEVKAMTCPFCGLTTYGDPCAFRLVCSRCSAEVRGGRVMSRGIGREAALAQEAEAKEQRQEKSKQEEKLVRKIAATAIPVVFESNDKYYENIEMVGIGGIVTHVREISRDEWVGRRKEFVLAA